MLPIKYPKTPYLPFSPTVDADDPIIDPAVFVGKPICLSVKMDGSNTAMTRETVYGRSTHHVSFNQIKQLHGQIKHLIPEGDHIFGEALVAKHSIHYTGRLALDCFFQMFGVYQDGTGCFTEFDYLKVLEEELKVPVVQTVFCTPSTPEELQSLCWEMFNTVVEAGHEGIVVRNRGVFKHADFANNVAKMVRPHHVQSKIHWTKQEITYNDCKATRIPCGG
jgi:hypothetical protein